ncbi:MAG: hypothetical protein Q8O38_10480 [Sulfurimicrobium sp.]|nr:hypothetical protein [Sulfurimicrobium sp.]
MRTQAQKQSSETSQAIHAAYPDRPPRRLFTLPKFAEKHSDFVTISAITNQVFRSQPRHSTRGVIPGNKMLDYGVIVRIGRRVLIDEAAYFRWLDALQVVA